MASKKRFFGSNHPVIMRQLWMAEIIDTFYDKIPVEKRFELMGKSYEYLVKADRYGLFANRSAKISALVVFKLATVSSLIPIQESHIYNNFDVRTSSTNFRKLYKEAIELLIK